MITLIILEPHSFLRLSVIANFKGLVLTFKVRDFELELLVLFLFL
jgi:hypothetical protein